MTSKVRIGIILTFPLAKCSLKIWSISIPKLQQMWKRISANMTFEECSYDHCNEIELSPLVLIEMGSLHSVNEWKALNWWFDNLVLKNFHEIQCLNFSWDIFDIVESSKFWSEVVDRLSILVFIDSTVSVFVVNGLDWREKSLQIELNDNPFFN